VIRERLRSALYQAGLRLVPVDDLANISARLQELGRYSHELAAAVIERRTLVTVIAFGERSDEPEPLAIVDSKSRLIGANTETIELEAMFPVQSFQIVVLADLSRLGDVRIFHGPNLLGWSSPIGFGKSWNPGERIRVMCGGRQEAGA